MPRLKLEYESGFFNQSDIGNKALNSMGAEGWELIAITPPDRDGDHFAVFKREVPANAEPVES